MGRTKSGRSLCLSGNVSFLGLNSSFDSASLVSQLVQLETQTRITPLETKKTNLQSENTFLTSIGSSVGDLRSSIGLSNISNGTTSLAPKKITTTDSTNTFLQVTSTDAAVAQTFDLSIQKLATNTIRKSSSPVKVDLTNASDISSANFKGGVTLSNGTVTINGVTATYTADGDPTIADIESFLTSFAGVTGTFNESTGKFDLTGVTSLGSSGDTGNMLAALGLTNAQISVGNVSGIQNLEAVKANTLLTTLGVTGTQITINGTAISYDPNVDAISTLVARINTTAGAKVNASYDAVNGELIFSNKSTGALSITVSSDGDITPLNITGGAAETLGDNAEFTISTLNGGATLVSNSNTVTGLIQGLTFNLNKVTTSAVNVSIAEDASGYKDRINNLITKVNVLISNLKSRDDSFSRSLISRIKTALTKVVGVNGTDTYTSFIDLGLKSKLDSQGKFTGYELTSATFDAAFADNPTAVNSVLYGKTSTSYDPLSNGDSGIIVQFTDLLNAYVDPNVSTLGIIQSVKDSISNQIKTTDNRIERAQLSIDALEARLKKQFSQLDTINAQFKQQQSALASLTSNSNA